MAPVRRVSIAGWIAVVPSVIAAVKIWFLASGNIQSVATILATANLLNIWIGTALVLFLNTFFFLPALIALRVFQYEWRERDVYQDPKGRGRMVRWIIALQASQVALALYFFGARDSNGLFMALAISTIGFIAFLVRSPELIGERRWPAKVRRRLHLCFAAMGAMLISVIGTWVFAWTALSPVYPLERVEFGDVKSPTASIGYVLAVDDVSLTLQRPDIGSTVRIPSGSVLAREICSPGTAVAPGVVRLNKLLFSESSSAPVSPATCELDLGWFWQ
ncbi:hypothetical protein [Pseudonocardia sp. TMWB2A]|uniref:hypothetical protein n=1 Tax=Pseudonocardia sp. TMWB2A TaxID=687430 RepID=UPI00307E47DC